MLLLLFILFFLPACRNGRRTPAAYLNAVKNTRAAYTADSDAIARQAKERLVRHLDFFSDRAYDDSTQVGVDTILYSSGFDSVVALIITKNPARRLLDPDIGYTWYYGATCYLGTRRGDSLGLNWIGPNFSVFYDRDELSSALRAACFEHYATADTSANAPYRYNMNDVRFWKDPVWNTIVPAQPEHSAE